RRCERADTRCEEAAENHPDAQGGGGHLSMGAKPEYTAAGPPVPGGQLLGSQLGDSRERRLRCGHEGTDQEECDAPRPQRPGRHRSTVSTPVPTVLADSLSPR